MGVRLLVMFSVIIFELGAGIAALVGIDGEYPYRMDNTGIAGCVMVVVCVVVFPQASVTVKVMVSGPSAVSRV